MVLISRQSVFSAINQRLLCWPVVCLLLLQLSGCAWISPNESLTAEDKPPKTSATAAQLDEGTLEYGQQRKIERTIYAGIGLGVSRLVPDTSEVPGWDVDDPTNSGKQITLGADLSRQLSVELHQSDLGSAGLTPQGRITYDITAASALLYAGKNRHRYRRQGISGYARIGVGRLENEQIGTVEYQQDNAAHMLYGLGLEYMFRVGFGLRADLIAFDKDVRYGQLALIYRLGRNERRRSAPILVQNSKQTPTPVVTPVAAVAVDPCYRLVGVLHGVNFETDSDLLTADAEIKLGEVARTLNQCPSKNALISGHTDNIGSAAYNEQLSKRRVQSVMRYLASNGVSVNRISGAAHGESQPLAANDSPKGRKFNRRVELSLD